MTVIYGARCSGETQRLRADLTCPTPDLSGDFCPAYTPPPYPITRGQVLSVLPFGNIVVTLPVNGAELKMMLENGVSRMPAVDGRFPQVSRLCFTYDIALPAGSRVLSAVLADASGNCTATPVDLTAVSSYKVAENDFMANGGGVSRSRRANHPTLTAVTRAGTYMDIVPRLLLVDAHCGTIRSLGAGTRMAPQIA